MNADGSDVKRLTYTSADGKRGSLPWGWSPASNKVAYSYDVGGNYEIYTVDVNNRNLERLTYTDADDYYPSWSSKDEIAFASEINSGTAMDIYIMNANGTNLQRLTSDVGYNHHPDWSPDSSKIAFTSNRDGRQRIYVMNKDGSNVQKVSPDSLYWCSVSRWSPDGKKFVLNGDVNEMTIYLSADLYIMNSDGTGLANITNNVPISNIYPDW